MGRFAGGIVWFVHLVVFTFATIGWVLPEPWYYGHIPLVILVKLNWVIWDCCFLTELEMKVRNDGVERLFTMDLFRSLGWKSLTPELTHNILNRVFWVILLLTLTRAALIFL